MGDLPLLFLLGWRTFPVSWRRGFCQALTRRFGGSPEGRGARQNPWRQLGSHRASKAKKGCLWYFRL
jgi:hypothetical protein